MIDCSWGATYIEPWTSLEGLRSVAELDDIAKRAVDESMCFRRRWPPTRQPSRIASTPSDAPVQRHGASPDALPDSRGHLVSG